MVRVRGPSLPFDDVQDLPRRRDVEAFGLPVGFELSWPRERRTRVLDELSLAVRKTTASITGGIGPSTQSLPLDLSSVWSGSVVGPIGRPSTSSNTADDSVVIRCHRAVCRGGSLGNYLERILRRSRDWSIAPCWTTLAAPAETLNVYH